MANIDIPQKRVENLETTLSNKQDKLPNGTTGYFLQKTSDGVTWAEAGGSSMGKSIGEVYYSQSSSAQDNPGGLPLFTGETIANADQVYPDFYTWVANHSDLQISAADYETAITTYGECPKYVIDTTNKTIRLPLLKNYVKMANTTDGITQSGAGLPNITGSMGILPQYDFWTLTGAFSKGDRNNDDGNLDYGSGNGYLNFDASLSNSIYGNSNTVTPAHTTLYPWVCAYNAAIPASTAQAAQFQQALSGKVDLASGVSQNNVDYVVESYQNGTSWYRVCKSGWCEQGGKISEASATVALLKEMADTNYSVLITVDRGTPPQNQEGNGSGYASSTTQIFVSSGTMYNGAFWRVSGYAATGA